MKLIEVWNSDLNKAYSLFKSIGVGENGFENLAFGMDFDMFKQYVNNLELNINGKSTKRNNLPNLTYILVDKDEYIGIFNLKPIINEELINSTGNVGYYILNKYRNLGYGTKGLYLLISKAKELSVHTLYISCYKDNDASLKIILKNGGYIHHQEDNVYFLRIINE